MKPVQFVQQIGAIRQSTAKPDLGNRIGGQEYGYEYGRHQIGEDEYALLSYLGIGDALHAT